LLWTWESESKEEPDLLRIPEPESNGGSDLLRTRESESESKEEYDLLWTPEPESKGGSDLLWTGEPERARPGTWHLARQLVRLHLLGRHLVRCGKGPQSA
jgi:hypothetical protein